MLCWHQSLLHIAAKTQAAVDAVNYEDINLQVQIRLQLEAARVPEEGEMEEEEEAEDKERREEKEKPDQDFTNNDLQASAYKQFILWLPAPRLRGWARAMAERLARKAMVGDGVDWEMAHQRWGYRSPSKYPNVGIDIPMASTHSVDALARESHEYKLLAHNHDY